MAWRIEASPAAVDDLMSIYRHLLKTHHEVLGDDLVAADRRAAQRIRTIREGFDRIARAPHIGTRKDARGLAFRHVTFDRTIYWFRLDAETETVRIEGIFHGGQDHLGRMLSRLMAEGGD